MITITHTPPQHSESISEESGIAAIIKCLETASVIESLSEAHLDTPTPITSDQSDVPNQMTDLRMAEYFTKLNTEKVRYWHEATKWIDYDGKRWKGNSPGGPFKYIKPMLVPLIETVKLLPDDNPKKGVLLKSLIARESIAGQKSLISMAEKLPQACIATEKLDQDQWLLNCRNGTINLKTGVLQPHQHDDYITKIVDIEYDPSATCPEFKIFIAKIMDNDEELISYMQRSFGYFLTGSISEQIVQIWFGTGSNGKGVLSNVLGDLAGEYATAVNSFLLLQRAGGGGDNNTQSELAKLPGIRVARISEIDKNSKLAEAQLKNITGGDPITCRALYHNPIVFEPTFKITLSCNYMPKIDGTDFGMWRRIHKIPFKVTIPIEEQDPNLIEKLRAELPGILNWALEGCLAWQKSGLNPPAVVINATADYKSSEDMFTSWLEDCCIVDGETKTKAKDLLQNFKEYSGYKDISAKEFGTILAENGFVKSKSNGSVWKGLDLLEPLDSFSAKSKDNNFFSSQSTKNAPKGSKGSNDIDYEEVL